MAHAPSDAETAEPDTPADDPQLFVAGALQATLLAHRGAWVRGHVEIVELRDPARVQRRSIVDLEIPPVGGGQRAAVVPLGLRPKDIDSPLEVRDASGAPVSLLAADRAASLAGAALLTLARGIGADDRHLRRVIERLAAGSSDEGRLMLEELASGRSAIAQVAWLHPPFQRLARLLAENCVLFATLDGGERRRLVEYGYDEQPVRVPSKQPAGSAYERLGRRLGWEGVRLRLRPPAFDDDDRYMLHVDAGPEVTASTHVDSDGLEVRLAPPAVRLVRLAPYAALLAAVLLTLAWIASPHFAHAPRAPVLVLAVPALLAAYLAGRPHSALLAEVTRGARRLLLATGAIALVGAVFLASGAPTPVVRAGTALAAAAAWALTALLLETERRTRRGALVVLPDVVSPQVEPDVRPLSPTRLALVACTMAAGLLLVALADNAARDGASGASALLWTGLLTIFVPVLVHAWRSPPRSEAIVGLVLLGVALYLVKVIQSPLGFTLHDELSTLRTTLDLDRFGHAFAHNPLIPVHPVYPALELSTSAVASVTGVSTFVAGLLVIGVLRVALMAALFLVFEAASSTRVAAVATVLYVCNPNFVFFDSQWAYESFALPLALVVVAMAARGTRSAWLSLPVLLILCVSHPLTTVAVIAFLLLWAAIDARIARRDARPARSELWKVALAGAAFMVLWALVVARGIGGYLGPVLGSAGSSLVELVLGESGAKRVFGAAGAGGTPILEQLVAFGSVGLALLAIAFGLRPLWRRFTPLGGALAIAGLVYPLTLPLRLTQAGTEISNRASEFVFIGVAFLAAVALLERVPRRRPRVSVRVGRLRAPLVVAAAGVALVGGVVIGTARYARLPGPYMVASDQRSVEPEGLDAAAWARDVLGPGNRIVTDRTNGLLMGSHGLQEPQGGSILGRRVPKVITSFLFDSDDRYVLVKDRIAYLVVDKRLSTALPGVGVYFERDEPDAYAHTRPLSASALTKYDAICPVSRIYDSGSIVIYDTRRMAEDIRCTSSQIAKLRP